MPPLRSSLPASLSDKLRDRHFSTDGIAMKAIGREPVYSPWEVLKRAIVSTYVLAKQREARVRDASNLAKAMRKRGAVYEWTPVLDGMIYGIVNAFSHTRDHATATKKFVSPSFFTVLARSTRSSPTANLNLSHVAGLSKFHPWSSFPFIFLAANTASLNAKNTVDPRKSGGSPIPLEL